MGMKDYVVGFLFSKSLGQLVLVEKKRPEWQAGKCNGVGGKIEEGETDYEAMVREFREETGKEVTDWVRFCTLKCRYATVYFFYAVAEDYYKVTSTTDEQIQLWDIDNVMETQTPHPPPSWLVWLNNLISIDTIERPQIIPNLRWLIQMARSFYYGEGVKEFIVTEVYHDDEMVNGKA